MGLREISRISRAAFVTTFWFEKSMTSAGCSITVRQHRDVIGIIGQRVRQDQVERRGVDKRLVAHELQVEVGVLDGADLPDAPVGVSWSGLVIIYRIS